MLDPQYLQNPDTVARIRKWLVPQSPDRATGTTITDYTLAVDRRGLLRLVGQVSGHPRLGGTWATTSPVWQLTSDTHFARTSKRWYRLAGLRELPDKANGSAQGIAIYGHCLTHDAARAHLRRLADFLPPPVQ